MTMPTPASVKPGYVLRLNDVDDAIPGLWFVYRNTDEPFAYFRNVDVRTVRGAQYHAEAAIRAEGEHVVRWHEVHPGFEYRAITGPFMDRWQVTVYRGRGGRLWNRTAFDTWEGSEATVYTDEAALDRAHGPLTPVAVNNVGALVEELLIYRARATYNVGPEECIEHECDDFFDEDGNARDGIDQCSHIETLIASTKDAMAIEAVRQTLKYFEEDVALARKSPDVYTVTEMAKKDGIAEVVEALQHNIREATE